MVSERGDFVRDRSIKGSAFVARNAVPEIKKECVRAKAANWHDRNTTQTQTSTRTGSTNSPFFLYS